MRIIAVGILLSLIWASQPAAGQATLGDAVPDFAPTQVAAMPGAGEGQAEFRTLDESIQNLKTLVMDLNRDLFLLEEELLFPANTQVAIFVSMDVGEFFDLDSVQIKLNNQDVANYLYTSREVDALIRGGVQKLYLGNIRAGEHELIAIFTGHGPHQRDYRRGATIVFNKGIGPKYIELSISDREQKLQPEFVITEWE